MRRLWNETCFMVGKGSIYRNIRDFMLTSSVLIPGVYGFSYLVIFQVKAQVYIYVMAK